MTQLTIWRGCKQHVCMHKALGCPATCLLYMPGSLSLHSVSLASMLLLSTQRLPCVLTLLCTWPFTRFECIRATRLVPQSCRVPPKCLENLCTCFACIREALLHLVARPLKTYPKTVKFPKFINHLSVFKLKSKSQIEKHPFINLFIRGVQRKW